MACTYHLYELNSSKDTRSLVQLGDMARYYLTKKEILNMYCEIDISTLAI